MQEALAREVAWGLDNAAPQYALLNACRALVYLLEGELVGDCCPWKPTISTTAMVKPCAEDHSTRPQARQAALDLSARLGDSLFVLDHREPNVALALRSEPDAR